MIPVNLAEAYRFVLNTTGDRVGSSEIQHNMRIGDCEHLESLLAIGNLRSLLVIEKLSEKV